MTKQEILNKLEEISDSMDMDMLNADNATPSSLLTEKPRSKQTDILDY